MIRERTSGVIDMNIYYSFNDFMNRVIEKADRIAHQRDNCGIEELFKASSVTLHAIFMLINRGGWSVFLAVVALLLLGAFGFFAAVTTFLFTPPGLIVAALFGAAAAPTIKKMYQDKALPLAVREVGEHYKVRWENADGNPNIIDNLLNEAANDLYHRASSYAVNAITGD